MGSFRVLGAVSVGLTALLLSQTSLAYAESTRCDLVLRGEFKPSDRPVAGSQGGRWFTDSEGKFYLGNSYDGDETRVIAEDLISNIYSQIHVPVPRTVLQKYRGRLYVFLEEVAGNRGEADTADHFVDFAWLGNSDAITGNFDNAEVNLSQAEHSGNRLSNLQIATQIRRLAKNYASNRDSIQRAIRQSELPSRIQNKLSSTLDARAKWLVTEALPNYDVAAAQGKSTTEALADQLRASYSNSSWEAALQDTRALRRPSGAQESLTDAEWVALSEYTGGGFPEINGALRGNLEDDQWEWLGSVEAGRAVFRPQIELITSALNKMADFKGIVQRVTDLDPSEVKKYEVGKIVTEKAFTRATQGGTPLYDGNASFEITSKHGKDISFMSKETGEARILFLSGSKFKVLNKTLDDAGIWHIKMAEQ